MKEETVLNMISNSKTKSEVAEIEGMDWVDGYYNMAYDNFLYLAATIDTELYNNVSMQACKVTIALLKSMASLGYPNIEYSTLYKGELPTRIYFETKRVIEDFQLDMDSLSFLDGVYIDNVEECNSDFPKVSKDECMSSIKIMFDVIDTVNKFRTEIMLDTKEFTRTKYNGGGINLFDAVVES